MNIEEIKSAVLPVFEKYSGDVAAAYLFGSMATGSWYGLSDIDFAVLLHKKGKALYFDARLSLYADLCRALKRDDVDIVLLNTTKNLFLLDEIVRNGIVVFEADSGLRDEFECRVLHEAIDFRAHRSRVIGF